MTDLLDAVDTERDPASFAAPTGSPLPPPAPPAPPAAAPPAPTASATGPILSADPSMNPVVGAGPEVPILPTIAVPDHQPRQDRPAQALPGTLPVDLLALQQANAPKKQLVRWGHVFKTVVWMIVLAALSGAGYLYGPDLYERHFGDPAETETAQATIAEETPAPRTFPATTVPPAVLAASFEVQGSGTTGPVSYLVTTDFTSGVAQTTVRRDGSVDLEVITAGDQALIRRVDDSTWYRTARGEFPAAGPLVRQDWVRFVDELFPAELRAVAVIEEASSTTLDGVPTRHLLVSIPSDRVLPPPTIPALRTPVAAALPAPTPIEAAPAAAPAPGATAQPDPAVAPAPADALAPLDPIAPGTDPALAPAPARTTVEIWIDGNGIVRQAVGADVFGVERLTVTATMGVPWAPAIPGEDRILPLDADAVVHLGL